MSVDYRLFLRKKPKLEGDAIGAMRLDVSAYKAAPGDPIEDEPWRDSIRWVIHASGRISDYDEWDEFVTATCKRCKGWLWDEATGELEGFEDVSDDYETADEEGRRWEAESNALERLIDRAATSAEAMAKLRSDKTMKSDAFRFGLTSDLVVRAARGFPLEPWRWALPQIERDFRRKLPTHVNYTIEESPPPKRSRATSRSRATPETVQSLAAAILAKPTHYLFSTPRNRAQFAKRGPLAAAIVEIYDRCEADKLRDDARAQQAEATKRANAAAKQRDEIRRWLAEPDVDPPAIERRRRGGEILAGIPRSTMALLVAGELDEAIADYAKRYEVKSEVARKVVDQHVRKVADVFPSAANLAPRGARDQEGM